MNELLKRLGICAGACLASLLLCGQDAGGPQRASARNGNVT